MTDLVTLALFFGNSAHHFPALGSMAERQCSGLLNRNTERYRRFESSCFRMAKIVDPMLPEYSDEDLNHMLERIDALNPALGDIIRAYLELRFEMQQLRK
jgi:hypothetical protein